MYVFVHAQGIKTVHAGGGSKNGKILSTQLLNDPFKGYHIWKFTTKYTNEAIEKPNNLAFQGNTLKSLTLKGYTYLVFRIKYGNPFSYITFGIQKCVDKKNISSRVIPLWVISFNANLSLVHIKKLTNTSTYVCIKLVDTYWEN